MENQYFTTWEIIKFFKCFLKNEKLNLNIKLSTDSSFANHRSRSHPILYIILHKSKKFRCIVKFLEFWAFGVLTFRNLEPSIPQPLVIFGCRLTDHSNFYAENIISMLLAIDILNSESVFFIIIDWLMNWLLRQWDFRISISLINDIWIVLSLKIPRSAFFCSGNFSFSALLFHKLLFQGIKFSVFDTSVNNNLYKFRVVS